MFLSLWLIRRRWLYWDLISISTTKQVLVSLEQSMAFIIDKLSSNWQTVDATSDPNTQGYEEFLICHRFAVDNNKNDFKYSASAVEKDSMPVELTLHGAKGKDPLHGVQRPWLKVKDNEIVGMDVCGERCEKQQ